MRRSTRTGTAVAMTETANNLVAVGAHEPCAVVHCSRYGTEMPKKLTGSASPFQHHEVCRTCPCVGCSAAVVSAEEGCIIEQQQAGENLQLVRLEPSQ